MPQFSVRVTTESSEFEEDIMILALANFRQYGAKAVIAPHASPYDRLLDLCILKKFKLLQSSLNIQRLFTGTIHKYPFYKTFKFDRVHIRSLNGPIPYHFDGEYGGSELEDYDVQRGPGRHPGADPRCQRLKKKGRIASSLFYEKNQTIPKWTLFAPSPSR